MAETIQSKKTVSQTAMRATQQQHADKKRQLVAQQQEDLKAMKQYYASKNQELDNESAAAVSHITGDRTTVDKLAQQKTIAPGTYNRKAMLNAANEARAAELAKEENIKLPLPKENDDFYKVQDRGSRLTNDGDNYVIEAYAPENEQNNLRVSVQSNRAVISGQRKSSAEAEQGSKKISTNSYQTFREEFKFDKPVAQEGMTRERVGDFIRFTIPKLEMIKGAEEES